MELECIKLLEEAVAKARAELEKEAEQRKAAPNKSRKGRVT